MPKKYYAQILLEVNLGECKDRETAEMGSKDFQLELTESVPYHVFEIVSAHVISDPSDEEFLETLCVK